MGFGKSVPPSRGQMSGVAVRWAVAVLAMACALLGVDMGASPFAAAACRGDACGQGANQPPPCRERYAERWGGDPRYTKPRPPECGVRCMFDRMRNGFCGPGCDYYAFRMYEYENGNVFDRKPCRY